MKKIANDFKVNIENVNYVIDFQVEKRSKVMPDSVTYSCMTFLDNEMMTPVKRFQMVYSRKEKSYWAWTGNVINEKERMFMESIAELLNDNTIKLAV
jgi:hypothetical protein